MKNNQSARTGRVKSVITDKGYGFITDDSGVDWFFHVSQLFGVRIENLRSGITVTFNQGEESGRGPRAENVWPLREEKYNE